ncbi:transcriptional regulatory protein [Pseudooceanicola batsensis HTCC2597]|uniref:Transcriptional regulatory protein n=1 Tax=Pseudooceanicola batsensis (strain ATCC BAA-863 / DSM 15984 / KCTC 12145 / HTCC2597) TaxID=252305 RepID=A3U0K8_PSEBH|nr:MarR family transcriptional regulator [Pseudooceanicola batsensis]EAQ02299.1 transcriptional regulatory protein [Pseudooceanicola batsensis HTCC2597]
MSAQQKHFEQHLSYALAAAHRTVSNSLSERLKKHGMKIEAWRVMECLDAGDRLTMGQLAEQALVNPSTLSKLVDRMVLDGLVHRKVAEGDHRQVNLLLTSLGRARMIRIRQEVDEQDQTLTSLLDADSLRQLRDVLSKLC